MTDNQTTAHRPTRDQFAEWFDNQMRQAPEPSETATQAAPEQVPPYPSIPDNGEARTPLERQSTHDQFSEWFSKNVDPGLKPYFYF